MADHLLELAGSAARYAESIVAKCTADRLWDPTPCPDMDVEHLAGRLIGGLVGFADVWRPEGKCVSTQIQICPDLTRAPNSATPLTACVRDDRLMKYSKMDFERICCV
jgi:hypothetical protein